MYVIINCFNFTITHVCLQEEVSIKGPSTQLTDLLQYCEPYC